MNEIAQKENDTMIQIQDSDVTEENQSNLDESNSTLGETSPVESKDGEIDNFNIQLVDETEQK